MPPTWSASTTRRPGCGDGHEYQGLFGASITQSGQEIVISAPYWTAARATAYAPPPWQYAGNPLVPYDLPESLSIASGTVIDQAGDIYFHHPHVTCRWMAGTLIRDGESSYLLEAISISIDSGGAVGRLTGLPY